MKGTCFVADGYDLRSGGAGGFVVGVVARYAPSPGFPGLATGVTIRERTVAGTGTASEEDSAVSWTSSRRFVSATNTTRSFGASPDEVEGDGGSNSRGGNSPGAYASRVCGNSHPSAARSQRYMATTNSSNVRLPSRSASARTHACRRTCLGAPVDLSAGTDAAPVRKRTERGAASPVSASKSRS